jgi:hypothetical protein
LFGLFGDDEYHAIANAIVRHAAAAISGVTPGAGTMRPIGEVTLDIPDLKD